VPSRRPPRSQVQGRISCLILLVVGNSKLNCLLVLDLDC
jgi:hypothetical protein